MGAEKELLSDNEKKEDLFNQEISLETVFNSLESPITEQEQKNIFAEKIHTALKECDTQDKEKKQTQNITYEVSFPDNPVEKTYNKFLEKAKKAQIEKEANKPYIQDEIKSEKRISISAESILQSDEGSFDYTDDEELIRSQVPNPYGEAKPSDLFNHTSINEADIEKIDWEQFIAFCQENGFDEEKIPFIGLVSPVLTKDICYLKVPSGPTATKFKNIKNDVEKFLCTFLNRTVKVQLEIVAYELANNEELREKALNHPQIQLFIKEFGAELYSCYEIKHAKKD